MALLTELPTSKAHNTYLRNPRNPRFNSLVPLRAALGLMRFSLTVLAISLLWPATALAQPHDRYQTFRFGVCYYPEQWPESYWEADARRMKQCGVNTVRMGEFGWALMEPRPGHYDFSLFDRAIETLGRYGIKTIFGTPTAAPPKWLTHNCPEVLQGLPSGGLANDQSRRQYCYNSPIYRRFSRKIAEALAQHYRGNTNIIGWQIDNEMNCEDPECFSDSCRRAFRVWLRQKYGTLDDLNTRWGTVFWSQTYSDWAQIDLPFPTPAWHNPGLMLDWKRFISDSATSYLDDQVEILRRYRPNDFLTHNGVFKNINYYSFSRGLDIYAFDNYPTFEETPRFTTGAALTLARGLNGRMMIMEQLTGPAGQTYMLRTPQPGQTRLWAMQTIAHGADGLLHFRWRSARRGAEEYWFGVLDHDDVPRARFDEFKREGLELQKIGPQIVGSRVVSQIAVIKDFEAQWVFDHQYLTKEINCGATYDAVFQAASEQRHNIDFIGPAADLSGYKLVFAPQLALMDDGLAGRLRRFVQGGGTLVMSAHSATKDRDNAFTAGTIPIGLVDLFGMERDSFQTYPQPSHAKNSVRFSDSCSTPVLVLAETLRPTTARVIATWDRDFFKASPAATEHQFGNGKAVYYGSMINLDAARCLVNRYATETGIKPLLAHVPEQVEVTRRTKGPKEFYFLLNHGDSPATITPGAGFQDLLSGEPVAASITLGPFGYRVISASRKTD